MVPEHGSEPTIKAMRANPYEAQQRDLATKRARSLGVLSSPASEERNRLVRRFEAFVRRSVRCSERRSDDPGERGEEAVSYAGCGESGEKSDGDGTSLLHSCEQDPQTITMTTMSSRSGTVETRRARPRASPHAGHLRSTVIWGRPRFSPDGPRVLATSPEIKGVVCNAQQPEVLELHRCNEKTSEPGGVKSVRTHPRGPLSSHA
jgi:hypothetical protein